MKRVIFLLSIVLLLFVSAGAAAQEQGAPSMAEQAREHAQAETSGEHGAANLGFFKWINFAILAGIIGYFAYKKGGAFFAGRTAMIRRDLEESARMKQDAEAQYAEIERRLAALATEVEALRAQARAESAAESDRVRDETGRHLAKLRAQAEQDIAAAGNAARQQLRAYAAELAVGLAEQKIRNRLTPEADAALISAAAADLDRRTAREAVVH